MSRRARWILGGVALLVLLPALAKILGNLLATREPSEGDHDGSMPPTLPVIDPSIVPANHRFVPVGSLFSVAGLGAIREVTSLEPESDVLAYSEADHTVRCARGGTGFVAATYRTDDVHKNRVQTQVVVCVDETGPCAGLPRVSLDLERFLAQTPRGEADLLAQGDGTLYGVCKAGDAYRLQTAPPMPPPMLRIIDALATGAYSLADSEFDVIRRTAPTTFSGEVLEASWISTASLEITGLTLLADGSVDYTFPDCEETPACTSNASLVRPGDLVQVGFGVPGNVGLGGTVDNTTTDTLQGFVRAHVDVDWAATGHLPDEARRVLVYRLIGLEVMAQALDLFDGYYGLRDSGVKVGYAPYWQTTYLVADHCFQDQKAECRAFDETLEAHERARIAEWRASGLDLWYADSFGYHEDGSYKAMAESAPPFDAFAGVAKYLGSRGALGTGIELAAAAETAVRGLAAEVGTQSVLLSLHSGPMRFALDGSFCEAEVCVSAFSDYFEAYERAVQAMLSEFSPGQVKGFGLALIEGGFHFDIRQPYENQDGYWLNRVGETGYNNPYFNLYLAR